MSLKILKTGLYIAGVLCITALLACCESSGPESGGYDQSHAAETVAPESQIGPPRKYETVSELYPAADRKTAAQIIRFEGEGNTLRLTADDAVLKDIPLENAYTAQILSAEWTGNNRYFTLTSHVNPSMNEWIVVDLIENFEVKTYYGFGFTWNEDWSNFYYIEAAPHFSELTADSLVDQKGRVFYQTQHGNRLRNTLAFTPDEQYFACEILTPDDGLNLLLLKKTDEAAMAVAAVLTDYQGVPTFPDNETLVLTENGITKEYQIKELVES